MILKTLIMAGGESTRFDGIYKPLMNVCGEPVLDKLVKMARETSGGPVYIVVSMWNTVPIGKVAADGFIVTWGKGFCMDLRDALAKTGFPALVLPGDMPLLSKKVLEEFISLAMNAEWDVVSLEIPGGCSGLEGKEGFTGVGLFKKGNYTSYGSVELCVYPDLLDIDSFNDYKRMLGECVED